MEIYGHIDVNKIIMKTKIDFFYIYYLENDLKIQNPAWHPLTSFRASYELSI